MKDQLRIEFPLEQKMCMSCKKNSPEYHELKLQMRFVFFNDLNIIKKETLKIIETNFKKINKFIELENGFDIFFPNKGDINKITRLFQRKYLCEEVKSKKIVGRDSLTMKDIWRHVLLINIINLSKGDKISIKGEDYYIKALNNNDLVLRGIIKGEKKVISYSIAKDYLKLLEKV